MSSRSEGCFFRPSSVVYASSLAALHNITDLDLAVRRALPPARRYLAGRKVRFPDIVEHKQRTRLRLSGRVPAPASPAVEGISVE